MRRFLRRGIVGLIRMPYKPWLRLVMISRMPLEAGHVIPFRFSVDWQSVHIFASQTF